MQDSWVYERRMADAIAVGDSSDDKEFFRLAAARGAAGDHAEQIWLLRQVNERGNREAYRLLLEALTEHGTPGDVRDLRGPVSGKGCARRIALHAVAGRRRAGTAGHGRTAAAAADPAADAPAAGTDCRAPVAGQAVHRGDGGYGPRPEKSTGSPLVGMPPGCLRTNSRPSRGPSEPATDLDQMYRLRIGVSRWVIFEWPAALGWVPSVVSLNEIQSPVSTKCTLHLLSAEHPGRSFGR
ncbi:hypothetical protein [Micromonospora sp. KC721]|uniref:hypothetical protein n=1 Tax=Micromonospora sp. KC721 TaxID=2530380 RepID=UPI0010447120|nr:hypothetical protein [Micromonospora sp. KC721]TDB82091.1 hypothetical protein E1182_03055 [Micromonospora sp. KC721]